MKSDSRLEDWEDSTPLIDAITSGLNDLALELITNQHTDINERDSTGITPLHACVVFCNSDILEMLLQHKNIDINQSNMDGSTALCVAAGISNTEATKSILKHHNVDVNKADDSDKIPLIHAVTAGSVEMVSLLLQHANIDINHPDEDGMTALAYAVSNGYADIVRLLIGCPDIDINIRDCDGASVLWTAVSYGHSDIVRLLLTVPNLDVNAPIGDNTSALWFAVEEGFSEIIFLLLADSRTDVNNADDSGRTVLTVAVLKRRVDVVEKLLEHPNIDVNKPQLDGTTPLFAASVLGFEHGFDQLFAHSCININLAHNDGATPLWAAVSNGRLSIVKRLLNHSKTDVHVPTREGMTVLHEALLGGHTEISRMILSSGSMDLHTTNDEDAIRVLCLSNDPNFKTPPNNVALLKDLINMGFYNKYVLRLALENCDAETVNMLYDQGQRLDKLNSETLSVIIRQNSLEKLGLLFKAMRHTDKYTFLITLQEDAMLYSCNEQMLESICKFCLQTPTLKNMLFLYTNNPFNQNITDCNNVIIDTLGYTLLHLASTFGVKSHVRKLLQTNANPLQPDDNGQTPLMLSTKHPGVFETMRAHCSNNISLAMHYDLAMSRRWAKRIEIYDKKVNPQTSAADVTNSPLCLEMYNVLKNLATPKQGEWFKVQTTVDQIMHLMATKVAEIQPFLDFKPVLVGSSREGTKIGYPDEYDYLCVFKEINEYFNEVKHRGKLLLQIKEEKKTKEEIENFGALLTEDGYFNISEFVENFHYRLRDAVLRLKPAVHGFGNIYVPKDAFQKKMKISCFHFVWRGREYPELPIKIDIVPTIPSTKYGLKKPLPVKVKDTKFYFITNLFNYGEEKEGITVAFNNVERKIMTSDEVPEDLVRGYRLAKIMRNGAFFPPSLFAKLELQCKIDIEDYLITYMIKTCLFFLLKDLQSGICGIKCKEEMPILKAIFWADKIYAKLQQFLTEQNVPYFFTNGDLFDCVDSIDKNTKPKRKCCFKLQLINIACRRIRYLLDLYGQQIKLRIDEPILVYSRSGALDCWDLLKQSVSGRYAASCISAVENNGGRRSNKRTCVTSACPVFSDNVVNPKRNKSTN